MKNIVICIILLSIFSCSKFVKKDNINILFSIPIGYDKNELMFSKENNINSQAEINYTYDNNFFYISDTLNNKILKITKNGNILLTIYNKENYPNLKNNDDILVNMDNTDDYNYLITYKSFELIKPSKITVDNEKNIFVVNNDPKYKIFDKNKVLGEYIAKFDKNGNFLYYIGREGKDSTPYGAIYEISSDYNNNLIVIEQDINDYYIYKYNNLGKKVASSSISKTTSPRNKSESDFSTYFVNIVPGYKENEIYVTYQYIKQVTNEITKMNITHNEIIYEKTFLYSLNSNKFEKLIIKSNPENIDIIKNNLTNELYGKEKSVPRPYETLLNIDNLNNIFMFYKNIPMETYINNDYTFMIFNDFGSLQKSITVKLPKDIQYISKLFLSKENNIYSFFIDKDNNINFILLL